MSLPLPNHRLVVGDKIDPVWWRFLLSIATQQGGSATAAQLDAAITAVATALGSTDGTLAGIPASTYLSATTYLNGGTGIDVFGALATGGVNLSLATVADTGAGALLAITRDAYGRTEGSRAAVPADIPTYLHTQSAASATWTINHNLGRKVAVSVFTVGGVGVLAEVINNSTNQAQVLLDSPADGYAILN